MGKRALLVVDTQVNMFDDSFSVYAGPRILEVISGLIKRARKFDTEVIFVRNNGSTGDPDEPNTPGWEIHPKVFPNKAEVIIDKEGTDPFSGTELKAELVNREIDQIVLVGMQTEMCIATTAKEAVKHGFSVILVEDGHTTYDWDELAAVDAIKKYNRELSEFISVQKAQEINFG